MASRRGAGAVSGVVGLGTPSVMRPTPRRLSEAIAVFLLLAATVARGGENLIPDPSFEEAAAEGPLRPRLRQMGRLDLRGRLRVPRLRPGPHRQALPADGRRRQPQDPRLARQAHPRPRPLPRHRLPPRPGHRHRAATARRPSSCSPASTCRSSKNGTFGWSRLTYVGEVKEKRARRPIPSFGLMAPGYFWVDDVSRGEGRRRRAADAGAGDRRARRSRSSRRPSRAPTRSAVPSAATATTPPGAAATPAARRWTRGKAEAAGPPVKLITSFEDRNPFDGGTVVARARHRRQEGAAHRPRLRRPGRAAELVRLRLPQGRRLTPTPRTRWSCTSRSATGRRATTGPGSITPPSSRRAPAR